MRVGDELEEEGAVDGQVAARAETAQREEDAEDVKAGRGAEGETKDGANEEGRVPGDAVGEEEEAKVSFSSSSSRQ